MQTKSFGIINHVIINGDRQQLSVEHGTARKIWWKSNFKQICFVEFFMKLGYDFRRFNCIGS